MGQPDYILGQFGSMVNLSDQRP